MKGNIIILNGVSSAGKSTLSARQQLQFVHQQNENCDLEVDTFINGTEKSAQAIVDFITANEATLGFSK